MDSSVELIEILSGLPMRRLLFVCLVHGLFFGPLAMPQSLSEGTASLTGVITGAGTPIVVFLQSDDENPTRYYNGYQVAAEKDGTFSFGEIKPGHYSLWAQAPGFMSVGSGDNGEIKIALQPDEHRTRVAVNMVHRRALCGRVTANGVALARPTWVTAFRYDPSLETLTKTFLPRTSEDGSYRFADLEPGTYYLQGYMTWYPGSFSFNGAKPVTVGPESEPTTCSLDIPLQHTGCRLFKVNGKIGPSADPGNPQYRVVFFERNTNGGWMRTVTAMPDNLYKAGDSFSIGVCPGDYGVVLTDPGVTGYSYDSRTVTVNSSDVDEVTLTPHPMASITGQVHFDGISRRDSCPGLGGQRVEILRAGDAQFHGAALDDKNHFEFHNVSPGEYTLTLGPFRRQAVYIKSIVVDGKPAEGRTLLVPRAAQVAVDITLSSDLSKAAGHLAPDLPREQRWEVAWTRPKGSVTGSVQGKVDAGYTVKLRSARYNSNASAEYTARAASDGSFQFDAVDPGVYTLRAESKDTLPSEYGALGAGLRGTPIVVNRGAHLTNLTLAPLKLSSLCGRVTDPSGTPRAGMRIFVETLQFGMLRGSDKNEHLETDADGYFRADSLIPGDYYLAFPWIDRTVYFSVDGSPSVPTPVHLRAGQSAGCAGQEPLKLRVPNGLGQWHSISGKVRGDLPKRMGDRFWISLLWDEPKLGGAGFVGTAKLDENHEFRLNHVPNGRFVLQLSSAYGPEPMTWSGPYAPVTHLLATKPVEVQDDDISNEEIAPMSLPSVAGTLRVEHLPETWKNFHVSTWTVLLVPREYRAPFSAKVSDDGTFSIDPEDVGDYEVQIAGYGGMPPPFYIQSMRLDGREITGRYFHLLPSQSAHLEVVLSGDSGQVYSTVTPDPSSPLAEPPVSETCGNQNWPQPQLLLLPDLPDASDTTFSFRRFYLGSPVGDADRPTLQALQLPPGRYRAVAAEHLASQYQNFALPGVSPETKDNLWIAIAELGESVTVRPGEKVEIALPDKTVDVARLAAKVGLPSNDQAGTALLGLY